MDGRLARALGGRHPGGRRRQHERQDPSHPSRRPFSAAPGGAGAPRRAAGADVPAAEPDGAVPFPAAVLSAAPATAAERAELAVVQLQQ